MALREANQNSFRQRQRAERQTVIGGGRRHGFDRRCCDRHRSRRPQNRYHSGQPALALAQLIDRLPGLRLRGLLCYDGGSQHMKGFTARRLQTLERLLAATETFDLFNRNGLITEIFSGGGTGSYNIDHETRGLTDIQVGSYVFMDAQYMDIGSKDNDAQYADFEPAPTVLATVLAISIPGAAQPTLERKPARSIAPGESKKENGMNYSSAQTSLARCGMTITRRALTAWGTNPIVSHCDPVVSLTILCMRSAESGSRQSGHFGARHVGLEHLRIRDEQSVGPNIRRSMRASDNHRLLNPIA